jgi:ArsR family transcriptional regulator, arsenate/arsenite/antimonite-responsive transcriptional repressor
MAATQIQTLGKVFQALGDETRLRILGLLLTGEVCVCDIHDSLKISQPKASRHLAYLRRAGLVTARRDGLWMHYKLADISDPVVATIQQAVTHTLTHVNSIRRDAARLQGKTGCCLPSEVGVTSMPCCSSMEQKKPSPGSAP